MLVSAAGCEEQDMFIMGMSGSLSPFFVIQLSGEQAAG